MYSRLFHLHALSALHCGTGQSAGVVDLPIARARATQLPIVPGSSLRGVLRQELTVQDEKTARTLFGPDTIRGPEDAFAGALAVGDAHLLTLPVRCLGGIICHVTSPFLLTRYARDLRRVGVSGLNPLPSAPAAHAAQVTTTSVNLTGNKLVLEDLDLDFRKDPTLDAWADRIAYALHPADAEARTDFTTRFALLPDDILSFLAETATEIRARIALDPDTGTVRQGALWYEENLPAETLLWGLFALTDSNKKEEDRRDQTELARALFQPNERLLQLGGKAGVGRGLVRLLTGEGAP